MLYKNSPVHYCAVSDLVFFLSFFDNQSYLWKCVVSTELTVGFLMNPTGFTLNNAIYQLLVARYSDPNMTIDFDNFVGCLMKLEMMFSE